MTQFGLTSSGLVVERQSDIISAVQAQLQAAFGQNINLSGQSVLGQILGIVSERLALLWELTEAVYVSQYPSGAEGTSVDNILALNNLVRLAATPSVTAPTDTAGVPGLVLYGTAGTVIPAGSIISVQSNSLLQFTLDTAVTIAAAVNAVQLLVLSAPPTSGAFQFSIVDPAGNTLISASLPWSTPAAQTQISWTVVPSTGTFKISLDSAYGPFTIPSAGTYSPSTTAAVIQAAVRALGVGTPYAAMTVTGSIAGTVATPTGTLVNGSSQITSVSSTAGLVVGMQAADGAVNIPAGTFITNIVGNTVFISQAATGNATETITFSGALLFNWGTVSQPSIALTSNSLSPGLDGGVVLNSLQSIFNTFFDSFANNYPFTDVTCTGSLAATSVAVNFGIGAVVPGQPVTSSQPIATIDVVEDSLLTGATVVNTEVLTTGVGTATGAPAQGIGSATATQTGPNDVPAGFLTVIGSPISGWTSVNNPLDVIPGTNVESDTQALTRRNEDLASNANGPLDAIAEKVSLVPGVVQAVGFQNLSIAALQILTFSAVPTSGAFTIAVNGGVGTQTTASMSWRSLANVQAIYFSGAPSGGSFTITMNSLTTGAILSSANAAAVQMAVRMLSGFSNAVVTGSFVNGLFLSFGAGAVQQYPISTTDSLTGASISATVPSVQAQINALPSYGFATVQGSFAATMVIAFNGSTGGQAQNAVTTPSNSLEISATPVVVTQSFGRPGKSFEIVVNDNNGEASNLLIAEAIFASAPAGISSYGNQPPVAITDSAGNIYQIYFSRPTQVPIYVVLNLQTDLTSSANPQFNVGSIITVQEGIAAVINAFKIGGLVVGFGTNGIIGAFNAVPGILDYTLFFGTSANPVTDTNIQLLPEQVAFGQTFNIIVSYE